MSIDFNRSRSPNGPTTFNCLYSVKHKPWFSEFQRTRMLSVRRLLALRVFPGRHSFSSAASCGGGGGDTLGRRLLSLIYPKRSAIVVLRRWAEEGKPMLQKYQLNRVVRELRNYGRFKHALEVGPSKTLPLLPDFPQRWNLFISGMQRRSVNG